MHGFTHFLKTPLSLLILIFLLSSSNLLAQNFNEEVDSLLKVIPRLKGTKKVDTQNKLALRMIKSEPTKASKLVEEALQLSIQLDYQVGIADSYNLIGNFHYLQGEYPRASEYFFKALGVYQDSKEKDGEAVVLLNIGSLYQAQNEFDKGMEYYQKALSIEKEMGNNAGIANCLNNIGNAYGIQEEYEKSLKYQREALSIYETLGNESSIANCLNNIANTFKSWAQYDSALKYYQRALESFTHLGNKQGVAICLNNLANIYQILGEHEQVLEYAKSSFDLAQQLGAVDDIRNAAMTLSGTYAFLEDYGKAYQYQSIHSALTQEIFNEENALLIEQKEAAYKLELKQKEIELKQKEIESINRSRYIRGVVILVSSSLAFVILVFAIFLYRSNKRNIRSNRLLAEQKTEIEQTNSELQKREQDLKLTNQALQTKSKELEASKEQLEDQNYKIEDKNRSITASINYALRIQEAMLPLETEMKSFFPDLGIFYFPRDIVSGDFYYFTQEQDKLFIAGVDCTGHGVPGAFMSMIGNSYLNQIIQVQKITDPGQILTELDREIRVVLHQEDSNSSQDGMELVLACIDLGTKEVKIAGAVSSMFMVDPDGKSQVIQGDRQSIGGGFGMRGEKVRYSTQVFEYQKDCTLYFFSDGYQDQFGGIRGRKYGRKRFYNLLQTISEFSVAEQEKVLESEFIDWRKENPQIDDVMVIVLKLPELDHFSIEPTTDKTYSKAR